MAKLKTKKEMPNVKHVAIIMDGNGRWAKKRGLTRNFGHRQGAEQIFNVTKAAKEFGIEVLTVYAFSTENWKRPQSEIDFLFRYLEDNFTKRIGELHENQVRVTAIGQIERLPESTRKVVEQTIRETSKNTGINLNIALSYGAKTEIVGAIKRLVTDVEAGRITKDEITEERFDSYLETAGLPPVDLLIRTSGESRVSNFLLWQIAYSELLFTPTLWPDFDREDLRKCLEEFQRRERRYGGL
ncbi:MAG: isoprenyl transferase [Bacilli bacterium]|jgi:undecaprenyl diphosphate synthase